MTLSKGLTRLAAALGLFAFVLGLSAAFAGTTHAQNPPGTFYGTASAGDEVEAWVGTASCGTATAGSDGFWMMQIAEDAACSPSDGDTVSFTLNGDATNETESWKPGGGPADAAGGVSLTLAAMAPTPATPDPEMAPSPAMPEAPMTGNAGLLAADQGSSPWLALSLGVLALTMVAGARAATGWQRGRVR
jgi:hypothetical protein